MSEGHRGIILAGGEGTRLGNHRPYNKQLALVYDRMMIEYPAQSLIDMGAEHIEIVTTLSGSHDLYRAYGGTILGAGMSTKIQEEPNGAAEALYRSKPDPITQLAYPEPFPVLCGDVCLDPAPEYTGEPTLFWHEFDGAENHTVWNPETNELVEKPQRDIGKRAIIAYIFDQRVYDIIEKISPAASGELELLDVYRAYMREGIRMEEYKGFFTDMGTPDGLLRAANHQTWRKRRNVPDSHLRSVR